ncbi:synaptotagmin-15-like [Homarus americanus]|uniref:synaptotagmin-15-like n=1 Tax=Homarus americanus TaxID=6706 RepID=UPI001C439F9E|nr:synaptotagmin-15-like [Homarus americanus]
MTPAIARDTHLGDTHLGDTHLGNMHLGNMHLGDMQPEDPYLEDTQSRDMYMDDTHLPPLPPAALQQPGAGMAVDGGGDVRSWALLAGVVGSVGVVLVVAGVWAVRRWVTARKNAEERQQILLWPGVGTQPCSFQTREIRFTLPPSLAPLASAVPDEPLSDSDLQPPTHASLTGSGGGSSGSSSTQDFASPSSSSLASLTSLDTVAAAASTCDVRRSSISDMRRRSLQGFSLGTLNPELYRIPDHLDDPGTYPPGHLGRLFLTLHYSQESEKLQVGLLRLRNLPSRTFGSTNACDPYVRLSVMPDERRYLQTKQKKKTCNPVFDEHFGFHIPLRCVSDRTLRITVFDGGRNKRQPAIGHVFCPLAQVVTDSAAATGAAVATNAAAIPATVVARDLVREEDCEAKNDLGELLVSLTFNDTLQRLTLTVFQARGLKVSEGETMSWVKVSLMSQRRVIKSKKTTIVPAIDDPQYNESFHFRLPPALEGVHLNIQLNLAPNSSSKGRVVSRVVIGSFMFARGRGLNHWNEVLSTPKAAIQYWHPLTE